MWKHTVPIESVRDRESERARERKRVSELCDSDRRENENKNHVDTVSEWNEPTNHNIQIDKIEWRDLNCTIQ